MFAACFNMHMVPFPCVLACVRRLCVDDFQHRQFRRCSGKRSRRPPAVAVEAPWYVYIVLYVIFDAHAACHAARAHVKRAQGRSVPRACAGTLCSEHRCPQGCLFFAYTLLGMLKNDAFHIHAACHTKRLPCRRARPHLRAGAHNAPQTRSDLARRDSDRV